MKSLTADLKARLKPGSFSKQYSFASCSRSSSVDITVFLQAMLSSTKVLSQYQSAPSFLAGITPSLHSLYR